MSRLRLRLRAGRPLPSRQDSRTPFSFHGRRMRTPRRSFGFPPPHKALSAEGVTDSNEKNGNEGSSGRRSSDTETVLLEVTGMRCGGCSANVKRTLLEHPQVTKASVNLLTGTAAITLKGMLDEEETETERVTTEVVETVEKKGFKCTLREGRESRDGTSTSSASSDVENDWEDFRGLALSAGFLTLCCGHHLGHYFHAVGLHQLAGVFGGHGGLSSSIFGSRVVQSVAATAAILGPGRDIIVDGFRSLKNGVPNMNTLVGIGTGAALAVGLSQALGLPAAAAWENSSHLLEEPVMLLSVILLGRVLEKRAKRRATRELRTLGSLVPQTSRLVFDQKGVARSKDGDAQSLAVWNDFDTLTIETNDVRPGDTVKILPGESIPVDGVIVAGESAVDNSLITGESALARKAAGDEVIAGTINYDGTLVVRATSSGAESTVKTMRDFVEAAQARDAPVQRLADSICGPFVYLVLGLSASTFLFWETFGYDFFKDALVNYSYSSLDGTLAWLSSSSSVALKFAVNVLVVACPCALGLATPTSVLVGTSLAARKGVLIRGGDVLEELAKVDTVVLDKTGTVTEGLPSVVSISSERLSEKELIGLAASLESNASASHPIASAIIKHYESFATGEMDEEEDKISVEDVEYIPGKGVKGRCNGQMTAVGSLAWVKEAVGGGDLQQEYDANHTLVYVGVEGSGTLGCIALLDSIRPEVKGVLERLQSNQGVKNIYMLSGDRQSVVSIVGEAIGIEASNAIGGLSPFDKSDYIEKLKQKGHSVVMIGDGINDTVALSEANVGIAVSGGMDAASDAADIILLNEKAGRRIFVQIEEALEISSTTFAKIKQNLAWALLYNAFSLPLATGALLPPFGLALDPALAGAMMAGSSLTVLINSLSIYGLHPVESVGNNEKSQMSRASA